MLRFARRSAEKWELIQRHCQLAVQEWGCEDQAMRSMRSAADGLFQGIPEQQDVAREIPARLDPRARSREHSPHGASDTVSWKRARSKMSQATLPYIDCVN